MGEYIEAFKHPGTMGGANGLQACGSKYNSMYSPHITCTELHVLKHHS